MRNTQNKQARSLAAKHSRESQDIARAVTAGIDIESLTGAPPAKAGRADKPLTLREEKVYERDLAGMEREQARELADYSKAMGETGRAKAPAPAKRAKKGAPDLDAEFKKRMREEIDKAKKREEEERKRDKGQGRGRDFD